MKKTIVIYGAENESAKETAMYFSGENVYALFPSGKDMIHGAHFIIENALHKRDARSLLKTQRAANFNPLFPYGKRLLHSPSKLRLFTFQSTLPIREETTLIFVITTKSSKFQSTLPIREETSGSAGWSC